MCGYVNSSKNVAEMRMLRWIQGNIRKKILWNEEIILQIGGDSYWLKEEWVDGSGCCCVVGHVRKKIKAI